jgi:predicted Ser/Thr protein kinase
MSKTNPQYWPSARHFTEAVQCPGISFSNPLLKETVPAIDRLGMPLVTSGQFAYVYKLKSRSAGCDFAVRCFRGYLGDRDQRYRAIQKHMQSYPLSFLSGFNYETDGILVGGQRFPILFMKWIEGPTLDLYLDEMMGRREVLLHLAEEWVKLVGTLREAGIAHGDLQHGNIIVEHGRLRLVDHDGMFVPEMEGWSSSELGHQHYQHPRRDARLFNAGLDNFSSLVIYLSLLALAEQPGLWKEHHDENLLFTKTDFIDPSSSSLFNKIKLLGPEHSALADVLAGAATGEPAAVPCLLDLVSVKSALPSWMNAPLELESKTKTREVAQTAPVLPREDSRWVPWKARSTSSSVPSTPSSATVQTLFGGSVPPPSSAVTNLRDPSQVWRNTPILAKELLGRMFLWWYWGIYLFLKFFGLDLFYSMLIAVACLAAICMTYGFIRAREIARAALQANLSPANTAPPALSSPAQAASPSWRRPAPNPLPPASITVTDPIIGNRALNIYHLQDCYWVGQTSPKNRISFTSPAEALSAGYKPCQVCLPLN